MFLLTNLSMFKEIRNGILKIFKLRNSKKNNHLNCSLWTNQKGYFLQRLQRNGQGPLSQKVRIIGGVTNMFPKVQ